MRRIFARVGMVLGGLLAGTGLLASWITPNVTLVIGLILMAVIVFIGALWFSE